MSNPQYPGCMWPIWLLSAAHALSHCTKKDQNVTSLWLRTYNLCFKSRLVFLTFLIPVCWVISVVRNAHFSIYKSLLHFEWKVSVGTFRLLNCIHAKGAAQGDLLNLPPSCTQCLKQNPTLSHTIHIHCTKLCWFPFLSITPAYTLSSNPIAQPLFRPWNLDG